MVRILQGFCRCIGCLFACISGFSFPSYSQITPPGLGNGRIASWLAIGVRQELDTSKAWQSMTYVGIGSKSHPERTNFTERPSIFIANQEFYHQVGKKGQYSLALSYRKQAEYSNSTPYERENPPIHHELRSYFRFVRFFHLPRNRIGFTIRQDFRRFFGPDLGAFPEDWQLRTRLRVQSTFQLDGHNHKRVILGAEALFPSSRDRQKAEWSRLQYRESRFSAFYSLSPSRSPFIFNFGYMLNLVGIESPFAVHFLAFDFIMENPFQLRKRSKNAIVENLE